MILDQLPWLIPTSLAGLAALVHAFGFWSSRARADRARDSEALKSERLRDEISRCMTNRYFDILRSILVTRRAELTDEQASTLEWFIFENEDSEREQERKSYKENLASTQAAKEAQVESLKTAHFKEVSDLKAKHTAEVTALKTKHATDIENLTNPPEWVTLVFEMAHPKFSLIVYAARETDKITPNDSFVVTENNASVRKPTGGGYYNTESELRSISIRYIKGSPPGKAFEEFLIKHELTKDWVTKAVVQEVVES